MKWDRRFGTGDYWTDNWGYVLIAAALITFILGFIFIL